MSIRISPNLPANVVEIGNEISQAKIDEINAGTLATQTWVGTQGFLGDAPSDGSTYGRKDGAWESITSGISDVPLDGVPYVRQNQAWANVNYIQKPFIKSSDFVTYGAYTVQASDFGKILVIDTSGGWTFDWSNSYPDDVVLDIYFTSGAGSPNIWNFPNGSVTGGSFSSNCWMKAVQHNGTLYFA